MDPCPFVRLIVESLALKLPAVSKSAGPGIHPSSTPCFCTLNFQDCPSSSQTAPLPLAAEEPAPAGEESAAAAVVFSIDPDALQRLAGKPASLTVALYGGRTGSTCGLVSGRLIGRVHVPVDLESAASRPVVAQSGWVSVGRGGSALLHLVVRSEPDPRFVFQFGGEPECSPVVYQVQGSNCGRRSGCLRQPVFSCRFSADRRRTTRSRSLPSNSTGNCVTIKGWLGLFGIKRDHIRKEQRKGWTVTIHDLSGSPVAAASMVTPFVPSPGLDRVSRSNPGAWLILQPAGFSPTNWKPWGRLEAWRERGPTDALGYRFELVVDAVGHSAGGGVLVAESSLSVRKGGRFSIDPASAGFVMGSTIEGEGKVSRPAVQVGVQHVGCMGDAALFVALAAAVDLSMDACQLFSQRLRKELCQDQEEYSL